MSSAQKLEMRAIPRTEFGRQAKGLRRQGFVPAAIYWRGNETLHVSIATPVFERVCRRAGSSQPVALLREGEPTIQVLINKVERHPISAQILHVVLLHLVMTEKVSADVRIRFIGEAPCVHDLDATILTQRESLRISALPADLPPYVDADLSTLDTLQSTIRVSDLVLPPTVTVLDSPDDVVATAVPPVKVEVVEPEEVGEGLTTDETPEDGGEEPG